MSLDIANKDRYVFYVNFRTIGNGTNFCRAEQFFNYAELVEKANDYVLSVERFRVPLNTIPMLPAIFLAIRFLPKVAGVLRVLSIEDVFSLHDFIEQMNEDQDLIFSLDSSGRAALTFDFTDTTLQLDATIAEILDMEEIVGLNLTGVQNVIGASPMFDRLDQLSKVQIEGFNALGMAQKEIVNTDVQRNILTDFLVPTSFSLSQSMVPFTPPSGNFNLVAPVRQDLEFNDSSNRRFIMFKSSSPIQNLELEITAVFRDGTRNRIRMAKRSIMEVKLAFWKKGI